MNDRAIPEMSDEEVERYRQQIRQALPDWHPDGGTPELHLTIDFSAELPGYMDAGPLRRALLGLVARLAERWELSCRPQLTPITSQGEEPRVVHWKVELTAVDLDCFNGRTPQAARRAAVKRTIELASFVQRHRGPELVDLELHTVYARVVQALEAWRPELGG